jgi:predicted metal-dependent peptidase
MKNSKEIIAKISDNLFLKEPLMFDVFCSHKLVENPELETMFRTGQRRIEYNPVLVEKRPHYVESFLKNEILRILMKHPYQRVPQDPNRAALKIASDITINEIASYETKLNDASFYNLVDNQSYEEYYKDLKDIIPDQEDTAPSQAAALWAEDEEMDAAINQKILKAEQSDGWGSLSGKFKEKILANKKIKMNYKKILMKFRTSMRSNIRSLTRLKPNRRYDFDYMGSRYKPLLNLLVAVDASGSISCRDLETFFSIINRFFKYETKNIRVLEFDTEITQELDFGKAKTEIKITGRGGTNFQPVINYYKETDKYDGMIIFTDGYACPPSVTYKKRILWIINNKMNYENSSWLKTLPGSSTTWIPD